MSIQEIELFLIAHDIWLRLITVFGAIFIGYWQILINKRLKSLKDFAAVSAVPEQNGKIKLINTGNINLYLYGFDLPYKNERYIRPRFLPVGTYSESFYWIDPPVGIQAGNEFVLKLYLKDEFGAKWISEHGGYADPMFFTEDGKSITPIRIWSYRTYKNDWIIE